MTDIRQALSDAEAAADLALGHIRHGLSLLPPEPDPPDPVDPDPEPGEDPVAPFPFSLAAATPIPVDPAYAAGFLWKPIADGGRPLVILISGEIPVPPQTTGYYLVYQSAGQWVIEQASHASAGRPGVNGGRHHLRFAKQGQDYPGPVAFVLTFRDGSAYAWIIQTPGVRIEHPAIQPKAYRLAAAPPGPEPDPEPGEDPAAPLALGHVLFSEARPPDRFGLPNCQVAASLGRIHTHGAAEIAVLHPWYDLPGSGATLEDRLVDYMAKPLAYRRQFCLDWVRQAAAKGCTWAGVDWEGPFLLRDTLSILEDMAALAGTIGLRIIHWPKLNWQHQLAAGQFADTGRAWSWASRHMHAVGFWDPSGTRNTYAAGIAAGRAAGFTGPILGLAYFGDAKGAPLAEDIKIIQQPWGGIFNPGHQESAVLIPEARRAWAQST